MLVRRSNGYANVVHKSIVSQSPTAMPQRKMKQTLCGDMGRAARCKRILTVSAPNGREPGVARESSVAAERSLAAAEDLPEQSAPDARGEAAAVRVLLIDDAAVMRTMFTRIAETLGHEPSSVGSAAEGLRCAATGDFPAIIVDGRLEGSDVLAYVGALRIAAPLSAVFLIASLEERALVQQAAAAGATGAILRPFRGSQIRDALAALAACRT